MPARRSISFRKLINKLSKSSEDLSGMGRYRSTEDLHRAPEFDETDESAHDDDVFTKEPKKIQYGPSKVELVAAYESFIDNKRVYKLTPVEGWFEKEPPNIFNEARKQDQYNMLNGILQEKGELIDIFYKA